MQKKKQTKPTTAQRLEQSRRDRAKNNKGIGMKNGKRIFGPARPPRRGRNRVVQGSDQPSEVTTISSAYSAADQGMGEIKTKPAPAAEDYTGGTRIYGCDLLAPVGTNDADTKVFGTVPATSALPADGGSIPVAPGMLKRLSSIASNFTKFIFRELCVEYRPMVGTSNDGGFALGWQPDADLYKLTTTTYSTPAFGEVLSLPNSAVMPFWKPACFVIKLLSSTLRYVDTKVGTQVQNGPGAFRQVTQGSFHAAAGEVAASGTGKSMGYVCVKYVCDLYGAAPAAVPNMVFSLADQLKSSGYTPDQIKMILSLRSVSRTTDDSKSRAPSIRSSSKPRSTASLDADGDWNMSTD